MHKKGLIFPVFSAFSGAGKPLFCWEDSLFSGIIRVSGTGEKSSGRQF
jgi:hypothetical protein